MKGKMASGYLFSASLKGDHHDDHVGHLENQLTAAQQTQCFPNGFKPCHQGCTFTAYPNPESHNINSLGIGSHGAVLRLNRRC